MKKLLCFLILSISPHLNAAVLPGLTDVFGNPVHSADEVYVRIGVIVKSVPQGYRYTYTLASSQKSRQNIYFFAVYLPDPYSSIVPGYEGSPWPKSKGGFPNDPSNPPPPGFVYSPESWYIGWVPYDTMLEVRPASVVSGFTFVSPYPPGIAEGYVEGRTHAPVVPEGDSPPPEFFQRSKYGPGKVVPVIGPVKRPGRSQSYAVLGCAGGVCDVRLDITGPIDPYGTKYAYTWTGPFGTATGPTPTVQLPPGTHTLRLEVRNAQGTLLATAALPIVVPNATPNNAATPQNAKRTENSEEKHENETHEKHDAQNDKD